MTLSLISVIQTPFGPFWLWAGDLGICAAGSLYAAGFGSEVRSDDLRRLARYGVPAPQPGELPVLEDAAVQLQAYFAGQRREFTLPLDLRGTPFQRAVWQALLQLPYGATTTYGEIARQLGKPGGAQSVGQAVGQNPIAVIVPCHRVIGRDGSLTGYAGGLERKQALLALERPA